MSDDIVKRLRGENWWLNVSGDEAADEIERLRSELEDALDSAGYLKPQSAAYKRIVKGHK